MVLLLRVLGTVLIQWYYCRGLGKYLRNSGAMLSLVWGVSGLGLIRFRLQRWVLSV